MWGLSIPTYAFLCSCPKKLGFSNEILSKKLCHIIVPSIITIGRELGGNVWSHFPLQHQYRQEGKSCKRCSSIRGLDNRIQARLLEQWREREMFHQLKKTFEFVKNFKISLKKSYTIWLNQFADKDEDEMSKRCRLPSWRKKKRHYSVSFSIIFVLQLI